eukprot:jgi/Psemu1/19324/gm1.19324_g
MAALVPPPPSSCACEHDCKQTVANNSSSNSNNSNSNSNSSNSSNSSNNDNKALRYTSLHSYLTVH